MPLPLVAAAGASLLPSAFKAISGIFQKNKANKINPVNPGYQINNAVVDNARILGERYNNYEMPGYGQALSNIYQSGANAFAQGSQGAGSGGDILDLATKIAYGQNNAINQLGAQNAAGREQALGQSLQANAAAGQEYQNRNAYDRDMYQQQLREKAALTQAANQNIYGALDTGAAVASSFLMPKATTIDPFANRGNGSALGSIFGGASSTQSPTTALPNSNDWSNMFNAYQRYKNQPI